MGRLDRELSPEERDRLVESLARSVTDRRLEVPVVLALEMHRPLAYLGSQALILFTPMFAPAFGVDNLEKLSLLMMDRTSLDRLIDRIEELAAERPRPELKGPVGAEGAMEGAGHE